MFINIYRHNHTVKLPNYQRTFVYIIIPSGTLAVGGCGDTVAVDEVLQNNYGNATAKAIPGTLHSLPWATDEKYRVGEVFCETFWNKPFRNGDRQLTCPRYIARHQIDRLRLHGYQLYSGFEAEFIVCDSAGKPIFASQKSYVCKRFAEYESFLYSMDEKMAAAGVNVGTFELENGSGQFELVTMPEFGLRSADNMFLLKEAVKEMCQKQNGWQATFMSKPLPGCMGNGHHFSHSLWSSPSSRQSGSDDGAGVNVFYDPDDELGLSTLARHWLAGLLRHAPALTALCSPTVNCYRRLHAKGAPSSANWNIDDRMAMIRAKTGDQTVTYFENRISSGSSNPYLVMAATVAAGLDGVLNKLECPAPKSASSTSAKLPESLSEALQALENDDVMRDALGEEFVRWFAQTKRYSEIEKIRKIVEETGRTEIDIEKELFFEL